MDNSSEQFQRVELLADEFVARRRRGESPSIDEYVDQHPDLESEIRDVFAALAVMEQVAPREADLVDAPQPEESPGELPLSQLGDYQLLREIGRGGMGVVYEAEQISLRRRVAVKILPRQLAGDDRALERFQREARAAARMHHTNIVPVFEVDHEGDYVFYAMQLIQGQGLDRVIVDLRELRGSMASQSPKAKHGRPGKPDLSRSIAASLMDGRVQPEPINSVLTPPPDDAVAAETVTFQGGSTITAALPGESDLSTAESNRQRYFKSVAQIGFQTADALSYAHARGIIHRDIKPSNLLLDMSGVVWVTDFGLAKTNDEAMTHTGDILGTLRYMSPERYRGQCDVRADLYSLGLTLYEMLTLKPAYDSSDRLILMDRINKTDPPAPRTVDARIPRDLETIVLKAIEKDPKRRYQSADELADDLKRFTNDEPIAARPLGRVEQLWRWTRRHPALAGLWAVTAVALLAVVGVVVGFAYQTKLESANSQLSSTNTQLAESVDREKSLRDRQQDLLKKERKLTGQLNAALKATDKARRLAIKNETLAVQQRKIAEAERNTANKARRDSDKQRLLAIEQTQRAEEILYGSRVFRAYLEYQANHVGRAERLLDKCPEEMRNWEWRYVMRLCRSEKFRWNLDYQVSDVAFSPDGKYLAYCGGGRLGLPTTVRNLKTGKIERTIQAHILGTCVRYSPNGKLIATAGGEGRMKIWNAVDGKLLHTCKGETSEPMVKLINKKRKFTVVSPIVEIRFTRDGAKILTLNQKGTLRVWNTSTGKAETTMAFPWDKRCQSACFSPDGQRLYLSHADKSLAVWSLKTKKNLSTFPDVGEQLFYLRNTPDGRHVVGMNPGLSPLRVLDAKTGGLVSSISGKFFSLAINHDGTQIVTGGDGIVELWDLKTGRRIRDFKGHSSMVTSIAFSRDGRFVASSGGSHTAPLADDRTVRVWDIQSRPEGVEIRDGGSGRSLVFSPDGKTLAAGVMQQGIQLREAATGKLLRTLKTLKEDDQWYSSVSFSPDGSRLISLAHRRPENAKVVVDLIVWDVKSGKQLHRIRNRTGSFRCVAFSPEGRFIVSGDSQGAQVWNTETGRKIRDLTGPPMPVGSIAFSPDGKTILGARGPGEGRDYGKNGEFRIWDAETGRLIRALSQDKPGVNSLAWSPDGKRIATVAAVLDEKTMAAHHDVIVWNAKLSRRIFTLRTRGQGIHRVLFSPDGKRIITAGHDHTLRIWNAEHGHELLVLRGFDRGINSVAVSPNGRRIAGGAWNAQLRIFDAPPAR